MESTEYLSDIGKVKHFIMKHPKDREFSAICSRCKEPFIFTKNSRPYRRVMSGLFDCDIICQKCSRKEGQSKSKLSTDSEFRKKVIKSSIESRQYQAEIKEQERINNSLFTLDNPILGIEELKEYEGKINTAHCICENCGAPFTLSKRKVSLYSDLDKGLLCKGCRTTLSKIDANKEKIIFNKSKMKDCHFKENQDYEGSDLGKGHNRDLRKKYKFICDICGNEFESSFCSGDEIPVACPNCYPIQGQVSFIEKDILSFIKEIYKGTILENSRSVIPPYELDIYLPDKSLAIEVDGRYWHNNSKKSINKQRMCSRKKIRLIMIYDYEWETKQDIIKDYLKSQIGIYDIKLGARECIQRNVPYKEAIDFLNKNHLQGSPKGIITKNTICLGLYYKGELVEIEAFNNPRFNSNYDWELIRECSKKGYLIHGGKEKLFKSFLSSYKGTIISYCEKRFFSGMSYEKIGFEKSKDSPPNYVYYKKGKILSRYKCMKHKLKKILPSFDESKTETENMINNGYLKLWDFGNYVFKYKK